MSRRVLGLSLIAVGLALVATAVFATVSRSTDEEPSASPTTSMPGASSPSEAASTTSTQPGTTTSEAQTTTSLLAATTTTTRPAETIEGFVDSFAAALASGDMDFVMSRLHPDVVGSYPDGTCAAWVSSQIMALSNYRLTGEPTGPSDRTVTIAGRQMVIADVYSAPVSFTFGGQDFDSSADFAVVGGAVYWLGMCE